jgi:hypothetical protein
MKITKELIEQLEKQAASTSRSQKGDVSQFLFEQGFFDEGSIPDSLKKRDKFLSGGNPIDIKKEIIKN